MKERGKGVRAGTIGKLTLGANCEFGLVTFSGRGCVGLVAATHVRVSMRRVGWTDGDVHPLKIRRQIPGRLPRMGGLQGLRLRAGAKTRKRRPGS